MIGMFERAKKLKADLKISNLLPTGTQVVLAVPATIAYPPDQNQNFLSHPGDG
jgi:nitrate/nitrite-specific signal transduction histidine kinase